MTAQKQIDLVLAYEDAIHRTGPTGVALAPVPDDVRIALRVLQVEAAREALKSGEYVREMSKKNASTYAILIRSANLRDEDEFALRDPQTRARVMKVPEKRPTEMQIRAASSFMPLYEFNV